MSDLERKARELLAYECPECGGENGHESEDGWLRCSRCSNPHDVTRHQAMQAIIAALTPPEGYVLVPVEPTEGILMSMALRSDHALGCPGYYDQDMLRHPGGPTHQQKLDAALSEARQQYEEVVGSGFYSPDKEAGYAAMLAARPEVK